MFVKMWQFIIEVLSFFQYKKSDFSDGFVPETDILQY